jgi:exoribonuclease R
MSSKTEVLKKVLLHNKKYDIKELKEKIKAFNNEELMNLMLELFKEEINNFDVTSSFDDYKYLYKCFAYFDECFEELKYGTDSKVIEDLKDLDIKISRLIKKLNRKSSKGVYIVNDFILEKIQDNISITINNFEHLKEQNTILDQYNVYDFLKHLIFDVKKFTYIEEIFNKFPELINTSNGKNSIFDEIIEQYINQAAMANCDFNMVYLKKVITFVITNRKLKIKEIQKKKLIDKLRLAIDNLKRCKMDKKEKEKIKYFLNELIKELKNVKTNNSEDEIDDIKYKYNLQQEFSNDAIQQMCNFKDINGLCYRDLRNKYIITIDANNAKSLDDAFSLEVLPNGNYLLGIYIADVSSYVKAGTHLDKEAYERGSTIYLPNLTIPMFPNNLTYNLFSLNTGSDKLVVSHLFEFSPNMNLVNYEINRSIVTINKNFSYNDINNIMDKGNDINQFKLLKNMLSFSEKLKNQNLSKGVYHEIKQMRRYANNKDTNQYDDSVGCVIVEEFMVLLNHFIAYYFSEKKLPLIYRINLSNCDKKEFIKLKENWNNNSKITNIVKCINEMYESSTYSTSNLGHYGLNLNAYAHTTIPIRNYASLINQRLVKRYLVDNQQMTDEYYYKLEEKLRLITKHLNERNELNEQYVEEYSKILTKKYKSN